MRGFALPAALLLLAGCAGGSGGSGGRSSAPAGPPPRVDQVGTSGYDVRISDDGRSASVTLKATPEAAWTGLLAAYQKLGIPVTSTNSASRTLGNPSFDVRRRLGDQPLSRYLDCGTNLSGVIANSYRVELSVSSSLTPAAGGETVLETRVAASAVSPQGASSGPVRCASTGRLETDIANLTQVAAG